MCFYAELHGDTHDDHIYGHIKMGHNSHYGHFPILAIMAGLNIAINVVFMGIFSKYSNNADQQWNRIPKKRKRWKVMAKINLSPK